MKTTTLSSPWEWVVQAAALPVAFAQVREDSRIDLEIAQRLGCDSLRVIMIASGGCTATALAACGQVSHLRVVDTNPAQLALCRLKLLLLWNSTAQERAELLGHAPLSAPQRLARLADPALRPMIAELGPTTMLAELGIDHCGRYERLFAHLREDLRPWLAELQSVLLMPDQEARVRRVERDTLLGRALDEAFYGTMDLPNLVMLFGENATTNSRISFARHFAQQTRHAIASMPTTDNPWLWQMLLGRFPSGSAYPWLTMARPAHMPKIAEWHGTVDSALEDSRQYDLVHLSNVLDWLSPQEARRTLGLAYSALRPGGYVLIRQLNSMLDIPTMGEGFEWLIDEARDLHARDRSFFYRALHIGSKPR